MPDVHAIDLSHWNTVSDWDAIAQSGVVGCVYKATEGPSYVDPTYASSRKAGEAAGLLWGAYHFMRPGDMRQQMEWFIKNAALPSGSRLALDHEDPAVSLNDLCDAVNILSSLGDYEIAIYSGHVIKDQLGQSFNATLANTSLWLAQYTSGTPSWPQGTWPYWSLWQFTDTGNCPGVKGDCDLNTFNGSAAACKKWFGAEPAPSPAELAVIVDIKAPAGVAVKVSINGKAM